MIRTLLFVPGNSPKMLDKSLGQPADVLVPDLEDSVPPDEKANARGIVSEFLPKMSGKRIFVRVNGMQTDWTYNDLLAVVSSHIEGISIGKMESRDMALELSALLTAVERERGLPIGHTRIIPWIETGLGVANVKEIATSTPRMLGLAFGAEDYTADMGVARTKGSEEIATARAITAIASRAADLECFDTPDPDYNDIDALVTDAYRAKAVGCKGKFVIHPNQVGPVNEVFQPSTAEVDYARRGVEVFEGAVKEGRAAVALDGKMVDTPVWKRAVKLLNLAEEIQRKK